MSSSDTVTEAVLSTNFDAIIAADQEGIIRFWNPGAERIFGYASGWVIGQSLNIIIPERLRKRHWEGYYHVRAATVMATSSQFPGSQRTVLASRSSSQLCHCGTDPTR